MISDRMIMNAAIGAINHIFVNLYIESDFKMVWSVVSSLKSRGVEEVLECDIAELAIDAFEELLRGGYTAYPYLPNEMNTAKAISDLLELVEKFKGGRVNENKSCCR